MSEHCDKLLRLIEQEQRTFGCARVSSVERLYGPGFGEAWLYAKHRFYLENGCDPSLLKLSRYGQLILA